MKNLVVALACGLCAVASAETLTWTGAATGNDATNFLAAANWSPARVPQGGDTLVMDTAVTLAPCEFDFGSEGITIQNSAKVISKTTFKGSGQLVKCGTGSFQIDYVCRHTGGVRIEQGVFQMDQKCALDTGPVWIVRTASVKPQFNLSTADTGLVLMNDFHILGPKSTNWDIQDNNDNQFNGKIVAEDDFWIASCWSNNKYNGTTFNATIDAPGHTATFSNYGWVLNGKSNASIEFATANDWNFTLGPKFEGTDPDATLTTVAKTFFQDGAKWPGHVDVQTASGQTPGTISIPAKTRIKVASLKIGGVAQPEGSYRKNSAPPGAKPGGTFVGDGILRVGDLGIVILVK